MRNIFGCKEFRQILQVIQRKISSDEIKDYLKILYTWTKILRDYINELSAILLQLENETVSET